ncbi:hypothetical protein IJS77_03340 [bacterium]|nr:hypothetical protein [bacterium]
MKILNIYSDFKKFEPTFDKWKEEYDLQEQKAQVVLKQKPIDEVAKYEQKRAKILVNTLATLDEYAQTKAEDIDSVSQTLLYIAVGALGAIGTFAGKKLAGITKSQKLAKTLPSTMGVGFALLTFLPIVRSTVINQVRANRMARFDGIQSDKLFHNNNFAVLTDEQQKEVEKRAKNISDTEIDGQTSAINRANIFNSLSVFKDLTMKQGEFQYLKNLHDKKMSDDEEKLKTLNFKEEEVKQSKKDKKLFTQILKKVDMESHYPLERIEKAVNVACSSLFAGGVLEYLVSDGILNLLNVKHKLIRPVLSWGLPVLTIMSLNKQLANFLNDAVKAVRYKKMQEFVNNPSNFKEVSAQEINEVNIKGEKKENTGFFDFFKQTFKDIDEYKKYQQTKRIEEKKFALAVRNLSLTQKQKTQAALLRRNAKMVINKLDDQSQKYASAMETITESTTIPLDIIAPILGTFSADKLHKAVSPKGNFGLLYKGLGALIAFLPAAMSEIYFVGQQRKAKRCAVLIANNQLQNSDKFLDPSQKEAEEKSILSNWTFKSSKFDKSNSFRSFKYMF